MKLNIAIIGTGNVGAALAEKWAQAGHQITLGVRNVHDFKGKHLLEIEGIQALPIIDAVQQADIILMAVPAPLVIEVTQSLGNTEGKIIVDAMNVVLGRGPAGFNNTADAILAHTQTKQVIKCFNTTGFNNMKNTMYQTMAIDMFMAGDDETAKKVVHQLAIDAGFETCYDVGGNDKFQLMEQFAFFWINLAMMRGYGREIGFKLMRR